MAKNLTRRERLKRNLLKVGEAAKRAGVLRSTVFFYANEGLLRVDSCMQGKYRLFKKDEVLTRMGEIKKLQRKGLTLDEIKKKLTNSHRPGGN